MFLIRYLKFYITLTSIFYFTFKVIWTLDIQIFIWYVLDKVLYKIPAHTTFQAAFNSWKRKTICYSNTKRYRMSTYSNSYVNFMNVRKFSYNSYSPFYYVRYVLLRFSCKLHECKKNLVITHTFHSINLESF